MNNLLNSARRFFKNKNTVTILGVLIILVLLFIGYKTQIDNATTPLQIPVATETIQPRTEITNDMVELVNMPSMAVSDNVIRIRSSIVGKYSNINSVIPAGSMFYKDTVVDKSELPDYAFTKVKAGEVVYNFPVDMESTYGNSIFPGNKIDVYMKVGDGATEKIMIGKLIENIEVLAVKDSSGRSVFENTSDNRTPSMLIFGLSENINIMLKKASYMQALGVELYPVPQGGQVNSDGATQVSTQQLVDYINAHSIDIPVQTTEESEKDELAPVITQKQVGKNYNVTITYPKGCGSTYTCTYSMNNGKAVKVTKTTQTVKFTSIGTIKATLEEKDKTVHTTSENVPKTNSTNTEGQANSSANTQR